MTRSKTLIHRIAGGLLAACLLVAAAALPAFAQGAPDSNATISFSGGDLLLVSADSIDFGEGEVTSRDTEYGAENQVNVVVSDDRGSLDGWQLTAQLGAFTIGGNQALQNATITVSEVKIAKANTNNPSATPTLADSVTMVAGSGVASPIATAASGQGGGRWTVTFEQAAILLAVKADTAREGLATARIDWVISDGV